MVLQHASTSVTTKGRHSRAESISTSLNRNPAGISNNMSMISLFSSRTFQSFNLPPNVPHRIVPGPSPSLFLSTGIRGPGNDKLSKYGSRAIMSRISKSVIPLEQMVREVTRSGNHQLKGIKYIGFSPNPDTDILRTLTNHGVCSKNSLGTQPYRSNHMCKPRTWWAGLCPGTGKVLSHLPTVFEVKWTVWKRRCRHDGVHDFDTRAHSRRDLESAPAAR